MTYTHRVYVKHPIHTKGRFYPINGEGGFAKNLIYALMYTEDNARKTVEGLGKANPEFAFEMRRI